MSIPFLLFWVLIFVARDELGRKGIAIAVSIWLALLLGFCTSGLSPYLFVSAQAVLDIVLVLKVFGGDIAIR